MSSYYNEFDKKTAAWLRELIKRGLIADGEVDDRNINEVHANDLQGFDQCHFFAGIGGWSYALRLAGWPDARPVWTGSPPCQPFSAAGKGAGVDDPRHLWPVYFDLIRQCRPRTLFGEQVAAAIRYRWIDDVQDDMEGEGYAFAKIVLPACSVGAPHIRQRLWIVADANGGQSSDRQLQRSGQHRRGPENAGVDGCAVGELGDTNDPRSQGHRRHEPEHGPKGRQIAERHDRKTEHWSDLEWLACADGKARPTESTFQRIPDGLLDSLGYSRDGDRYILSPLIQKTKNRVMRLRGYGNAISPQVAAQVIGAYMEIGQ